MSYLVPFGLFVLGMGLVFAILTGVNAQPVNSLPITDVLTAEAKVAS